MASEAATHDAIILGAGPAGLTAGLYLARARRKVLIVDTGTPGGQTNLTHAVANYPGLAEVPGYQLALNMRRQAEDFGCRLLAQAALQDLSLEGGLKAVAVEDEGVFRAPALILATGGRPRSLGLPSEEAFKGRGISYCATCDGDFYTGKPIAVIGGGNSALEEAVALTRYASKVTVLHQFHEFQAMPHYVEEARRNPKVTLVTGVEVQEFVGNGTLRAVAVRDKLSGRRSEHAVEGAFIFIGYAPNSAPFKGLMDMSPAGEILTSEDLRTSLDGVWAAGDLRRKRYRQVTTAVADGTVAALSVAEFLAAREAGARAA